MPRQLPPRPSLEQLKKQAKSLLKHQTGCGFKALTRIRESHPRWRKQIAGSPFTLVDAKLVIATEYGFSSWSGLQSHVNTLEAASTTAEILSRFTSFSVLFRGIQRDISLSSAFNAGKSLRPYSEAIEGQIERSK